MAADPKYKWEGDVENTGYIEGLDDPSRATTGRYSESFEDNFSVESPFGYLGFTGPASNDLQAKQFQPYFDQIAAEDRRFAADLSPAEIGAIRSEMSGWSYLSGRNLEGKTPDLQEMQKARRAEMNKILENYRAGV